MLWYLKTDRDQTAGGSTAFWRATLAAFTAALALLLLPGCKPAQPEHKQPQTPPPPSAAQAAPAPALALDDDPITLPSDGSPASDDPIPVTPGDFAWRDLQKSLKAPTYPPEWQTNEPSDAEMAAFKKKLAESAGQAADRVKEFYAKFPEDARVADAREQEQRLLAMAVQMGDTNRLKQVEAAEQARLNDPKLSEEDRLELRVQQLQRGLDEGKDSTNALPQVEAMVRTLRKEFPNRPEVLGMMMNVAEGWLGKGDFTKTRALAQEVVKADLDPELTGNAKGVLKKLDRVGKPLALKFKGLDGKEVDLGQLTNKVVLVDFWATWCAPCMTELPKVKAAYEKLHAKGFEILGISFDEAKENLERVVQGEKIPWAQHFDASGENPFAKEFDIASIPTMWLVDRKGVLRDLNAREQLAEKVEKLLAE